MEVSSVAVFNDKGELLFGCRRDTRKWSLPGGGLNTQETPLDGAIREVKEETNLDIQDVEPLSSKTVAGRTGRDVTVHAFKAKANSMPDSSRDPDREFGEFRWVDVSEGLPAEILENLHSPKNVVLDALGLLAKKLEKALDSDDFNHVQRINDRHGPETVNHKSMANLHPPSMKKEKEHWEGIVKSPATHFGIHMQRGSGSDEHGKSDAGISPKTLIKHPKGDVLIKPFHERPAAKIESGADRPTAGWAEMANQGLYHAAGIGHLHQKVHVTEVPSDRGPVASYAVHMAKNHQTLDDLNNNKINKGIPDRLKDVAADHAKKIAVMDFLSGNFDRHVGNVMVSNKGLLAIDNAYGFQYKYDHMNGPDAPRQKEPTQDTFEHYFKGKGTHQASGIGPAPSSPTKADYDKAPPSEHRKMTNDYIQARNQYDESMHQAFAPTFEWWKQASPNVRATMDQYLKHVVDKPTREHIKANFNARADWLDAHAEGGLLSHDKTWSTDPVTHHLPYQFYEKPAPAPARQHNDAAPYIMTRS